MARQLRVEYPGAVYHVTVRGNDRRAIFHSDADRHYLLALVGDMMARYDVVLHAYVLMNNHYHLVIRTLRANLSRFMHDVNTGFSVWSNRRHNRTGHVFEGRFKAIVMEEAGYLLAVSAYVHLNPVRVRAWKTRPIADRQQRLEAYPWSSFHDYTQRQSEARTLPVTCSPAWGDLGARTEREGRARYREYVREWLTKESSNPLGDMKRGCYVGDVAFGEWIEQFLSGSKPLSDQIVSYQEWHETALPTADMLLQICELWGTTMDAVRTRRRPHPTRDAVIYLCRETGAKTLREIGQVLGIKVAAVSTATQRVRRRVATDKRLEKQVQAAKVAIIELLKT